MDSWIDKYGQNIITRVQITFGGRDPKNIIYDSTWDPHFSMYPGFWDKFYRKSLPKQQILSAMRQIGRCKRIRDELVLRGGPAPNSLVLRT